MAHGKWSEVEAREILEAWRRSGVTMESFAKQRGIVPQRLRWWRYRLKQMADKGAAPGALPQRRAVWGRHGPGHDESGRAIHRHLRPQYSERTHGRARSGVA